jgi:hypothetical protein
MVLRRNFLKLAPAIGALGRAWSQGQEKQEKQEKDVATAGASVDTTHRVGIVLSSFTGSEDDDGTKIQGLADPSPVDAELSASQIDAMLRQAISLGTTKRGGLTAIVASDDWVVIKPRIETCYGLGPGGDSGSALHGYIRGTVTDLRLVRSLIEFLVEHKCGARFTIAEGSDEWQPRDRSKAAVDGWTTEWGGEFGGLSYDGMIRELSRKYPKIAFDRVDLNFDEPMALPLHGKALARNNREGSYFVPKTIQQCDRIVSVAPLATCERTGISLSAANYWGIAPGAQYGFPKSGLLKLGQPDEVVVDLFSYHPADYAIVGGTWGVEGGWPSDPGARAIHRNVLVAGTNAISVDAVGAAIMGFDPTGVAHLTLAEHQGFGDADLGPIWVRGNEIKQALYQFRKPANWKPSGKSRA